jgi:hypothetical protein
MIQGEAGLRAEPRGPRHAPVLRLAGWESAASGLTDPATKECMSGLERSDKNEGNFRARPARAPRPPHQG